MNNKSIQRGTATTRTQCQVPNLSNFPKADRSRMQFYYSERHVPLVYWHQHGEKLPNKVLTVENCSKWYSLYLVDTKELTVTEYKFDALEKYTPDGESPWGDHVPNPKAVEDWCHAMGWDVDSQSLEMMIGRWEIEVKQGGYSR